MLATYKAVMVVSGSGFFELDGKNLLIRSGDLFFLFPDVKHHYFANPQDPWTLKWFTFNGKSCKEFMSSLRVSSANPVMRDSMTRKLMNGMDGVIEGMKRESAYPFAVVGSAYLFFDELLHIRGNELAQETEPMAEDAQLKRVLTFIDLNTANDLSVESVCRHLNYSRSHFSHFFKNKTGMSLPEYINLRRVERAKELLLSTDMNNSEIAMSVGCSEPMYFHRAFKKITSMTPQHFRMENMLHDGQKTGEQK
jgi:AraC-like DNA-binding protein